MNSEDCNEKIVVEITNYGCDLDRRQLQALATEILKVGFCSWQDMLADGSGRIKNLKVDAGTKAFVRKSCSRHGCATGPSTKRQRNDDFQHFKKVAHPQYLQKEC